MSVTRRQMLGAIGTGLVISTVGVAGASSTTERVFVHPRTGLVGDAIGAVEALGGTVVRQYENFDFVVAEIPANERETLLSDVRIAFVESDDGMGIPSDWVPSLGDLLGPGDNSDCRVHPSQQSSWGIERIGADTVDPDGSNVDIGILDTGIQSDHCSLDVAGGRNFTRSLSSGNYEDGHGHGTHVAGIAGASDNDLGVVGVAPASNLYAVKVLDDSGSGRYSWLVAGIDWCMSNDIELISMSLGGESSSDSVDRAIEEATAAGHLLLCAAGNEGQDGDGCAPDTMIYPATHPDVIAVTAMDEDDSFASYSSVGSAIDLLAPGSDIRSTYTDNRYARASGTSMACPFVTGVAALVWEQRTEVGPGPASSVKTILAETAESVLESCREGDGLVDAGAAVSDERATGGDESVADDDGGSGSDRSGNDHGNDRATDEQDSPSFFERLIEIVWRLFEFIANLFR